MLRQHSGHHTRMNDGWMIFRWRVPTAFAADIVGLVRAWRSGHLRYLYYASPRGGSALPSISGDWDEVQVRMWRGGQHETLSPIWGACRCA